MEGSAAVPPPPPPPPGPEDTGPNKAPPDADPEEFFGGEPQESAADSLLGEEGAARPTGTQVAEGNGDKPAGSDPSPATEEAEAAAPPPPPAAPDPPAAEEPPVEPPAEGPKTPSRKYQVIREVRLTEKLLKALLDEVKKGDEANARLAYFALGEEEARSVEIALRQSYGKNRAELGPKARMGAIGSKGWRIHDVEPKPVQAERIQVG